tara:strand:+ start:179 stop:1804 length:1626 start_codon:yes stop_codon:yes gene_type:complete
MAKEVLEMEVKSNIGEVAKDTEKLDGATKKASKGFKGMGTAIKGVGMALKAAGIGLVVALFVALQEALQRNQKVMNAVNTVMTTVSTTFNQVANVLVDVYDWVTKSSDRFDGLTKVISGLMTIALTPLKLSFYAIKLGVEGAMLAWEDSFLGGGDEAKIAALRLSMAETANDIKEVGLAAIDAGKDIGNNIGDAIGEIGAIGEMAIDGISKISVKANYEQAKATTAAQNSSKLAEAQIQGLIEKNDLLSETQRQIRDDETKTFAERIAANKELGDILDKQEVDMMKLADTRVASAALELAANKDNIDLQVAYQQTLNDRAGVEAQVAGFRSEQLTNEVSLNKELLESQKEIRAEGLSGMELELQELQDAYDLKIKMAEKAGMKTTAITNKFEAAKTKIVKDNENAKLAAISGFASAVNALAGEQKGIAVATALMNTYLGVTEVMKDSTIPSTSMKFLAAGTVLAGGLANVQNILKQDVGSGSGGGGGGVSAPAAAPAPQMMSGAFELSGGVEPEPTRAYVVTDEMTNSQNQLANIRRRATI